MTAHRFAPFSSAAKAAPLSKRPTAQAARVAMLGALAVAPLFAGAQPSTAQPPGAAFAAQRFDVPAGPLAPAISRFAATASVGISFESAQLQGLHSAGLQGTYTVDQGFAQLLRGSGWEAEHRGGGNYALRKVPLERRSESPSAAMPPTSTLPPVTVMAQSDPVALRTSPPISVGSKIALAQREIAQSVSVVTTEQIETQNMHVLEDALRNVPGVTVRDGDSERPMFYSRGFPMESVQYDGVPVIVANSATTPGLIMFDRVEVLRGPAGVLNGLAGSGGAVNLVRKRAPKELQASAEVSAGSYDNYRGSVDVGGAVNDAGTLRARVAASQQERKFAEADQYRKDTQFYGTIEADLDAATTLRLGLGYQSLDQRVPWNGLPAYDDYTLLKLPKSRSLLQSWNRNTYKTSSAFAELEHRLDNGWTSKLSTTVLQHRNTLRTSLPVTAVDKATGDYMVGLNDGVWDDDQHAVDAYASGPYTLFGRTHQLVLGANYQDLKDTQANTPNTYRMVNLAQPDFPAPAPAQRGLPWISKGKQYGVYANTRLSLADPLTLVLGGRFSWWTSDIVRGADDPLNDSAHARFTPNVGLVYDIDRQHALYASHSGIFTPQFVRDATNHVLKPIEGNQQEIGLKGEYLDGRLNASVALFRVNEKNRAQQDLNDPSGATYFPKGRARSQGVETQVSGEALPGLKLLAGYTFTQTKYLDSSLNTNGDFETYTPRHLLKLWANYRLPGELQKWSVGTGAYVSSRLQAIDRYATPNQALVQGGYATFDLRIAYQVTPKMELSLNVNNLFDRSYYRSLGFVSGGNFIGSPREALLTMRIKL